MNGYVLPGRHFGKADVSQAEEPTVPQVISGMVPVVRLQGDMTSHNWLQRLLGLQPLPQDPCHPLRAGPIPSNTLSPMQFMRPSMMSLYVQPRGLITAFRRNVIQSTLHSRDH